MNTSEAETIVHELPSTSLYLVGEVRLGTGI